jgi:hypothetical protein
MTSSDDDVFKRLEARSKVRESHREEVERIEAIVRRQTDKQIFKWLWLMALIWLGWSQGWWLAVAIGIGSFFAVTIYEIFLEDRMPGALPHLAEVLAEEYVRHQIIAELHMRGELKWIVKDGEVSSAEHQEWHNFWERWEKVLPQLEALSPVNRQKSLLKAKAKSLAARKEMLEFALQHNAKPIQWLSIEIIEDAS